MYFPFAIASLVAVPLSWAFFPSALIAILVVAAALGLGLILGLSATCEVEGELAFGLMIPLACLWDSSRLGAFGPAEVMSARVVREHVKGYPANTRLQIRSRSGDTATFGPFPEMTGEEIDRMRDKGTRDLVRRKVVMQRRAFDKGVEWLAAHDIPLGLSTPRQERLRTRRMTRRLVVGIAVTGPAGAVAIAALASANVVSGWNRTAADLIWWFMVAAGVFAAYAMLDEGLSVSGEEIFRSRVPLGLLDRADGVGAEPPSAVASWHVRATGITNSDLGRRLIEVKFRHGGKSVLGDRTDESQFAHVQAWLEEHCPETRQD